MGNDNGLARHGLGGAARRMLKGVGRSRRGVDIEGWGHPPPDLAVGPWAACPPSAVIAGAIHCGSQPAKHTGGRPRVATDSPVFRLNGGPEGHPLPSASLPRTHAAAPTCVCVRAPTCLIEVFTGASAGRHQSDSSSDAERSPHVWSLAAVSRFVSIRSCITSQPLVWEGGRRPQRQQRVRPSQPLPRFPSLHHPWPEGR